MGTPVRRQRFGHTLALRVLIGLLPATCLSATQLAWADGGAGGSAPSSGPAGAGGTGYTGNPGGSGSGGGGGGGGGAGGGRGGSTGLFDGLGGNGGPGGESTSGGGGGGGGGAHGAVVSSLNNSSLIVGQYGFTGGGSIASNGSGGGGGAGGYGVVVGQTGSSVNRGGIVGGDGGSGGVTATSGGGNGGDGGVGVFIVPGDVAFTNIGAIVGGTGGQGGQIQVPSDSLFPPGTPGNSGSGGVGLVAAGGVTVFNTGGIAGGLSFDGSNRANAITFSGNANTLVLQAGSNIVGNVVVTGGGSATLALDGNGTFDVSSVGSNAQYQGFTTFLKSGPGTWTLSGTTTATMPWIISGGTLSISSDGNLGAPGGSLTLAGGTLQTTQSFTSLRPTSLGAGNTNTFSVSNATTLTWNGDISGNGGLIKIGAGTLILGGSNSYTGGTTVVAGILQGNSTSLQGNIVNNTTVVFDQKGIGTYAGAISGAGGVIVQGGGRLTLSGISTYTGSTQVFDSTLTVAISGCLSSTVALNRNATLGGSGCVGGVSSFGGTVQPGNSIGTLTVTGALAKHGGTYVLEIDGQGNADRIAVGGTALINGGTVQVQAAPGRYANSTTYTIVNAAGGLSGSYAGVSDNLAFLTPTLSYDANNAYLTLALQGNAFSGGALTNNQRATGSALDRSYATASGDFATVIGALAGLSTGQGPVALDAISGQQYANFGTTNVANAALFMNALGQQMANARSGSLPGSRVALAQACEVETCDDIRSLSAWISGLGGLGSVQGNANSSTLTYNMGGTAVGVDYRFDPRYLLGLGVGYTHGTQWTGGFPGQGWSDALSLAAYGSFTQAGFYADAMAGYATFSNQMQRQIQVPNLQPRTASGSTGANQFLTQLETGYKLGLWEQAMAITPFGRLQFSTTTQNAFTESGAQSLSLNVAQQTTNSLRTVLGADFAGSIPLANQRRLDLALRLGWQHEFANTARPITAAFAGAPGAAFTVYGAAPKRDAAIVGLSAATTVADATQLYVRYDGMLGSGIDNHALTAGFRLSW
jgi:outer membrane autotransporter protein